MCHPQDSRAFQNPFLDNYKDINIDKLHQDSKVRQRQLLDQVLKHGIESSKKDPSFYTGLAGIALMLDKVGYKDQALKLIEKSKNVPIRKSRITFLCGLSGPLAISAKLNQSQRDLKSLLDLSKYLSDPDLPNELLYGRVGYLYALLYVKDTFPNEEKAIEENIKLTVDLIIQEGIKGSRVWRSRSPLMFSWHDKAYFGS